MRSRARSREANRGTPEPRVRATVPNKLRSRFRHVKPRVSSRLGRPSAGPRVSVGSMYVIIVFSKGPEPRWIKAGSTAHGEPGVSQAELDRWAAIASGRAPDDDPIQRPPTDEELNDSEIEAIAGIEAWGRAQEERIEENARERRAELMDEARHYDQQAEEVDGAAAVTYRRLAAQREAEAEAVMIGAQRQMDRIADQVREERQTVRRELQREAERIQTTYTEHVSELANGLQREIKTALETKWLHGGSDLQDVEGWDFM